MSRTVIELCIHDALRLRLLRGEVGPDMRLVDHAIAEEMGVSRMPVREALMQLVSEGYLESTSRGFALPNLKQSGIAEVFVQAACWNPCGGLRRRTRSGGPGCDAGGACGGLRRGGRGFPPGVRSVCTRLAGGRRERGTASHAIQRYSGQVQSVRYATSKDPAARHMIIRGLRALLNAFEAQNGLARRTLILRFIYDAETAYTRIEERR